MSYSETPQFIPCGGERMLGILALPAVPADIGIVLVVGGPQTRVGSHRQFVLLSRCLAAAGYAVLRFDYRGMGDSSGEQRGFERLMKTSARRSTRCRSRPLRFGASFSGVCVMRLPPRCFTGGAHGTVASRDSAWPTHGYVPPPRWLGRRSGITTVNDFLRLNSGASSCAGRLVWGGPSAACCARSACPGNRRLAREARYRFGKECWKR